MKKWALSAITLTFFYMSNGGYAYPPLETQEPLEARNLLPASTAAAFPQSCEKEKGNATTKWSFPRLSLSASSANFLCQSLLLVSSLGMAMAIASSSSSEEEARIPFQLQLNDGSICDLRDISTLSLFKDLWKWRGGESKSVLGVLERRLCQNLQGAGL